MGVRNTKVMILCKVLSWFLCTRLRIKLFDAIYVDHDGAGALPGTVTSSSVSAVIAGNGRRKPMLKAGGVDDGIRGDEISLAFKLHASLH